MARAVQQKAVKDSLDSSENAQTLQVAQQKRSKKVNGFTLAVDLTDTVHAEDTPVEIPAKSIQVEELSPEEDGKGLPKKNTAKKSGGCLKRAIYTAVVLVLAVAISYFSLIFLIDAVGLNQPSDPIDVEIPQGSSTQQIAQILADKGVIEKPLCFRIYSRITGADGKYQLGMFTLSADMGYTDIVEKLQTVTPRPTVNVTIPEGYTVQEIAKLLSEQGVCDEKSFYEAVMYGEFNYDFVRNIPTSADGAQYAGRIYRLEGYLFPDTYNFYKDSSGHSAVEVMLKNFDKKMDATLRAQIAEAGMSMDEAIIMASVIQGEAASFDDMAGVSRVLKNRLAENSGFPKLQCDATRDYVQEILPSISGITVKNSAYNTYEREGLPVGAINNPGLDAMRALLHPSEDPDVVNCYYFATDYNTGITYFSKTLGQHEATCRRYKIGMYG